MAHTHTRFGQWFGSTAIVISSTLMLASNAVAQDDMIAMTPHFITTTTADAVLRAGDSDNNYVVANPPADLVLRADAERDNWYRVSYPAGSTAYVKAEDAEISSDGSTLFVKNANAVKAKNTRYGARGSWRFIRFEPPVKTTDAFKVLSTEQDSSGKSIYVVELPLSARAFVHKSYVRDATPTEIKEHEAGLAMLGLSYTGKVTTPTQTSESNTPTTNENSAENTAQPQPANNTSTQTETPDPLSPNTETPTSAGNNTSTPVDPSTEVSPAIDPTQNPGGTPIEKTTPKDPYEKYMPLLNAFDAVQKQDIHTAEFSELINEYQIALAKLDPIEDASMHRVLSQRLELLVLRRDLQGIYRDQAEQLAKIKGINQTVEQRLQLTDPTRKYNIIGRLETSAVYNGDRMPMMYRIQSVGEAYPRTLAYIKPTEKFHLGAMVGRVVGVVGETKLSKGVNLNIVDPVSIETLQSGSSLATPTSSTPANTTNPAPAGAPNSDFVYVPDENR